MANKREFKKAIEAIGASACDSMVSAYYDIKDADQEKISQAIEKLLGATAAAKSNADIAFRKKVREFENIKEYLKAKKAFYKDLFKNISDNFSTELNGALKELNAAVPQAAKEENKANVQK